MRTIGDELKENINISKEDLRSALLKGDATFVCNYLLYFCPKESFAPSCEAIRSEAREAIASVDTETATKILNLLVEAALSLESFLPSWYLRRGNDALNAQAIDIEATSFAKSAVEFADNYSVIHRQLLSLLKEKTILRFNAESRTDAESIASSFVGESIADYLRNYTAEIKSSTLRTVAEKHIQEETITEIGNDFASHLQHALYCGASMETTNPPLVDMAWIEQPEKWNDVLDKLMGDSPNAPVAELAKLLTFEVVVESMQLFRPLFLISAGDRGRVCLQVNPENANDGEKLAADALFFYEILQERLDGEPNVIFKLPATKGGLHACRTLTKKGIGVTITVNFGMYQHLPFIEAIDNGTAQYSCVVEMNGRLAFPIRDELLEKLDELSALGISEKRPREAAAWSGVMVAKKMHGYLTKGGYDLKKIRPLIASLRIYDTPEYDSLPNPFIDITECIGASIISVFPNVRAAFDQLDSPDIDPNQIESSEPEGILEVLSHSEIFKQAWYVDGDDLALKPDYPLTLDDINAVTNWAPNKETLDQFCDVYGSFRQRIEERKVQHG